MCVCFNKNGIILYMSFYNFLFKRLVCHWHISLSFCAGLWGWLWASLLGKPKAELKVFPLAFGGSFDSLRSGEVALYTGKEHSSFIASVRVYEESLGNKLLWILDPFCPFLSWHPQILLLIYGPFLENRITVAVAGEGLITTWIA